MTAVKAFVAAFIIGSILGQTTAAFASHPHSDSTVEIIDQTETETGPLVEPTERTYVTPDPPVYIQPPAPVYNPTGYPQGYSQYPPPQVQVPHQFMYPPQQPDRLGDLLMISTFGLTALFVVFGFLIFGAFMIGGTATTNNFHAGGDMAIVPNLGGGGGLGRGGGGKLLGKG